MLTHTQTSRSLKILLFDLGNVIVRWNGMEQLAKLSGETPQQVINRLSNSSICSAYEVGQCSDDQFIIELLTIFNLPMSLIEAKIAWQNWVGEPYLNTQKILERLRENYKLACLSNTNSLHWDIIEDRILISEVFDANFASHLMGLAKPSPKIYIEAAKQLDACFSDIVFFDDLLVNVEAARKLGITAHLVNPQTGVVPLLFSQGYLHD